jgi:hypothetical protein
MKQPTENQLKKKERMRMIEEKNRSYNPCKPIT